MTADQWAARLLAIHAAREAGDPLPFGILCGELAALEATASAVPPLALTVIDPEPKKAAKKVKPAKEE